MRNHDLFERVLRVLPRTYLEGLARDFGGTDRPWHMSRKDLEKLLITKDTFALRKEIAEDVYKMLGVREQATNGEKA